MIVLQTGLGMGMGINGTAQYKHRYIITSTIIIRIMFAIIINSIIIVSIIYVSF